MLARLDSIQGINDLTNRPLGLHDAPSVTRLMAAQDLFDIGKVMIEEADIIGDWQRPSFDIAADTIGVFTGEELIGYAEVTSPDRGDAAVHPDYRGRGIGTALALWMQERARRSGSTVIGMPVPEGSPSDRLLASLGYHVRWTSWVLTLPQGRVIDSQPLPEGYLLKSAVEEDYPSVWTVIEDAFLEWSMRERQSFEDFAATVIRRPGFEPWNLRVVTDPAGEIVGVTFIHLAEETGFVDRLAVRADHRRRGIARALLADAFAQARAHGATKSEVSTDSRTGALGVYERVGMEVTSVWVNRAINL